MKHGPTPHPSSPRQDARAARDQQQQEETALLLPQHDMHGSSDSGCAAALHSRGGHAAASLYVSDLETELAALQPDSAAADACIASATAADAPVHGSSKSTSGSSCEPTAPVVEPEHTRAVICLCGAHALARWGWRTWEFAVALILIKLFPTSLLLVSVFGLLDNCVRLLFGSYIGQFVDRTERLRGALTCYAIQNICIAASAAAAGALVLLDAFADGRLRHTHPVLYWLLAVVTLVAGASSSVGSLGAAVAVEREYAATLCGGDSAALRKLNACLRAIDLTSQMLAPVVSGLLMSYSSMFTAIVVLLLYCLAAWFPEAWCLSAAHRHSARLRQPKTLGPAQHTQRPNKLQALFAASGWAAYFRQTTLLPGLALAFLYLTVLSLGFLMTSFLAWQGLSESTISLFRSAGALSGLLATVVQVPLQRCGVGLVAAGGLAITWQLSCLLAGVLPILLVQFLKGSDSNSAPAAAAQGATAAAAHPGTLPQHLLYVLLSGLVASRFGLWLFDLAVTQLQQELVQKTELGTVSGVQASVQSAFEILSFVVGVIISNPQHFPILMAGSCAAVATAASLYYLWALREHWRSLDRHNSDQACADVTEP